MEVDHIRPRHLPLRVLSHRVDKVKSWWFLRSTCLCSALLFVSTSLQRADLELTLSSLKALSSKWAFFTHWFCHLFWKWVFSISHFIWKLQFANILVKNHPRLDLFLYRLIIFCSPLLFSTVCFPLPFFRASVNSSSFWMKHKKLLE